MISRFRLQIAYVHDFDVINVFPPLLAQGSLALGTSATLQLPGLLRFIGKRTCYTFPVCWTSWAPNLVVLSSKLHVLAPVRIPTQVSYRLPLSLSLCLSRLSSLTPLHPASSTLSVHAALLCHPWPLSPALPLPLPLPLAACDCLSCWGCDGSSRGVLEAEAVVCCCMWMLACCLSLSVCLECCPVSVALLCAPPPDLLRPCSPRWASPSASCSRVASSSSFASHVTIVVRLGLITSSRGIPLSLSLSQPRRMSRYTATSTASPGSTTLSKSSLAAASATAAPVIRNTTYTPTVTLTGPQSQELAIGGFDRRIVIVVRPGGKSRIVFRDEQLRFIQTPAHFYQAHVIYLTNDHEPSEIDGLTIFDDNVRIYSTPATISSRLRFTYTGGGSYLFRDQYSMLVWSGNTEQLQISHAEVM